MSSGTGALVVGSKWILEDFDLKVPSVVLLSKNGRLAEVGEYSCCHKVVSLMGATLG